MLFVLHANAINVHKILMSAKVKHGDETSKYFIGYADGDVAQPLRIMLPQMVGYIKCLVAVKHVFYN